jgi:hypothetical protein
VISARSTQVFNETKFMEADGSTFGAASAEIDMRYDPATREPLGGRFVCTMDDGAARPFGIEAV